MLIRAHSLDRRKVEFSNFFTVAGVPDLRLPADVGDGNAVRSLLQDERLLCVRKLRTLGGGREPRYIAFASPTLTTPGSTIQH